MQSVLNIDKYFERIGYEGPEEATLEVLHVLHLLHPKAIAFENLNPFLGIPVKLDTESIQQKLIHNGRGGYCFEQNLLFKNVLERLGFGVKGLAARILWNRDEGEITSRGHMLLLVETEGKQYIADVGFGGLGPTGPLLLKPNVIQKTPHESYRLIREGEEYILQSDVKREWKPLYRFSLEEHYRQDYEITNWYLSNHPESHFVTGLIAARPEVDPNRRYSLQGNQLSIHTIGKETEKQTFGSVSLLKDVLENQFGINLPDVPDLDEKLGNIIGKVDSEND